MRIFMYYVDFINNGDKRFYGYAFSKPWSRLDLGKFTIVIERIDRLDGD